MKPNLKIITSWDDGHLTDLDLHPILRDAGIPSVFFIPTNCNLDEDDIRDIGSVHEIGGHTVTHPQDLKLLNDNDLNREIGENKKYLENILKRQITKFCYPRGRYDDRVIQAVKNAGYTYARTTKVMHTDCADPFQQHTSVHVFPRTEYHGEHWSSIAMKMAGSASSTETLFHLWGHTEEVIRIGEWDALLKFIQWLQDNFTIQK